MAEKTSRGQGRMVRLVVGLIVGLGVLPIAGIHTLGVGGFLLGAIVGIGVAIWTLLRTFAQN